VVEERTVEKQVPLAVRAVDLALATIAPYGRADLEGRLRATRVRLLDDRVRVLVVGEFKQGKSLLVNALLSAPVCPVFDDVATAVATAVSFAPEPELTLVRSAPDGDGRAREQRTRRTDVTVDELAAVVAEHVTEARNPQNGHGLARVEVGLPRTILEAGLEVVDTPGVGGLTSVHGAATMAALPSADAVLLVSDASQEYTLPSWSSSARPSGSARTWRACSPRPTSTRSGGASPRSTAATWPPPGSTPSCSPSRPRSAGRPSSPATPR
jgi:hypothetical protein